MGCRWIDGDVGQPGWRYCQKPRLANRSYCPAHHARSINPQGDNRYTDEAAECDLYLRDLPPPNDDRDDDQNNGVEDDDPDNFNVEGSEG